MPNRLAGLAVLVTITLFAGAPRPAAAAAVGIFGQDGNGPGYAAVLNANGHTAIQLNSFLANDPAFLANLDVVILGRTPGTPAIESFVRSGGALNPVDCFRALGVRESLIGERGMDVVATGL